MKVLVDTSVWSLALRRSKAASLSAEERKFLNQLTQAVQDGRVAMLGPIRQELLSGIRDANQFTRLREALRAYPDELLETPDHEGAAVLYNECRGRGITLGPVDVLICACAARRKWEVLTRDVELAKCHQVAESIRLKLL